MLEKITGAAEVVQPEETLHVVKEDPHGHLLGLAEYRGIDVEGEKKIPS